MRIAGSLPLLPQRLMVSLETRSRSATSPTVRRSGRFSMDSFLVLVVDIIFCIKLVIC